jgi:hypothetical protein
MSVTYNQTSFTYDQPLYTYDGDLVSGVLGMRAFITRPTIFDARARIARQQGWPIPDPVDPAFPTFQPTQLNMRGRITHGSSALQTLSMRGNIRRGDTLALQMRARIVLAGYLQMRARIKPRFSKASAKMIYYVSNSGQTKALMLFYTQGFAGSQSMTMKARIAPVYKTRMTSQLLVTQAQGNAKVIPIRLDSAQATDQILTLRARIAVP